MLRRLLNLIPSWWSREPIWLLAALIVVGGTWGFIELAEEVIEGDTQAFDEWAVRSLRRPDDPGRPIEVVIFWGIELWSMALDFWDE